MEVMAIDERLMGVNRTWHTRVLSGAFCPSLHAVVHESCKKGSGPSPQRDRVLEEADNCAGDDAGRML